MATVRQTWNAARLDGIVSGDRVDWPGALYTHQTQLALTVHVGGKSALELIGYDHYRPAKWASILYLFGYAAYVWYIRSKNRQ